MEHTSGSAKTKRPLGGWGALVILISIITAFALGLYSGKTSASRDNLPPVGIAGAELGKPGDVDASIIWEVWKKIESKYVDKKAINNQELIYGAAEGLVKALGDPYSAFLPPQDAKRFEDDVRGSFGGIGAEIGIRKETLTVISPLEDSPAKRAGLRAGDKIVKIDETFSADLSLDQAVNLIRGPLGTEVLLTVVREEEKPQEIKIKREIIKIPVIKVTRKDNGIIWIQIFHFTESLPSEFRRAIADISRGDNIEGIVLDVRNNPGGFLEVAVDTAGWFLKPQTVVTIEEFGDASRQEYKTSGKSVFGNTPVTVIINGASASASEILAGALRDQRGIKLIGEKSFGKGSVQELQNLSGGASLKITIAKWLTPNGEVIQDKGLEPDIIVELTNEDIEKNLDPQLEKALELLR